MSECGRISRTTHDPADLPGSAIGAGEGRFRVSGGRRRLGVPPQSWCRGQHDGPAALLGAVLVLVFVVRPELYGVQAASSNSSLSYSCGKEPGGVQPAGPVMSGAHPRGGPGPPLGT